MKAGRGWRSGKILKKRNKHQTIFPTKKNTHTNQTPKKKLENHTQQTSNFYKKKLHIKNNSQKLNKKNNSPKYHQKSSQIAYHNFSPNFFTSPSLHLNRVDSMKGPPSGFHPAVFCWLGGYFGGDLIGDGDFHLKNDGILVINGLYSLKHPETNNEFSPRKMDGVEGDDCFLFGRAWYFQGLLLLVLGSVWVKMIDPPRLGAVWEDVFVGAFVGRILEK